jgi:hypothetical protein
MVESGRSVNLITHFHVMQRIFDPGSVHVGFVVNKVALGQVYPRVLRFSPVSLIPPVLHYTEKQKKHLLITFITGLHNTPQGWGASVASAAGPFTPKRMQILRMHGAFPSHVIAPSWRDGA